MKKLFTLIGLSVIMGCVAVHPKLPIPNCNELTVGIPDGYGNICSVVNTAQYGVLYIYLPK